MFVFQLQEIKNPEKAKLSNSTLESLNSLLAGARKSRRQARPPEKTAPTHKPKFEEHFIPIEDKKKEMLAELMEFCTGNRSWRLDSPKCIVIHIDAIGVGLKALYRAFSFVELPKWRKVTPSRPNSVNVSSHFGIAKDGETWQFVPLDIVSVHAVGYMHNSISFELVAKRPRDVTDAQVEKLVDMVAWLCQQYPSIEFVFGHDESYTMRHYFAQKGVYKTNPRYEAWAKGDPGAGTMVRIRERLKEKYGIEKKPG